MDAIVLATKAIQGLVASYCVWCSSDVTADGSAPGCDSMEVDGLK